MLDQKSKKMRIRGRTWVQHLCFEPNNGMDYELTMFEDVMNWWSEALAMHVVGLPLNDWVLEGALSFDQAFLEHASTPQGGNTVHLKSIATSMVSAFKNDRRLFRTDAGHLGSSTVRVKRRCDLQLKRMQRACGLAPQRSCRGLARRDVLSHKIQVSRECMSVQLCFR